MSWQQITLVCSLDLIDKIADMLSELEACAVTYTDNSDVPQFEEFLGEINLWPETKITALFPVEKNIEHVLLAIKSKFQNKALLTSHDLVEEKDWQEDWKLHFKPLFFGKDLAIYPSWHQPNFLTKASVIMDPGMAFGTGSHETTQLMLEWLTQINLNDKYLVDYGCGSGILAIAAAKLSAKFVDAVDYDFNAVKIAKVNAAQNYLRDNKLAVYHSDNYSPKNKIDILLANILANPLKELAPYFATIIKQQGYCILSGILTEQEESVVSVYNSWFIHHDTYNQGNWLRLTFTRK